MKAILGVLAFVVLVVGVFIAPSDFESNDMDFDPQIWGISESRTRGRMARSTVRSENLFLEKSKAEVKELLGTPDLQGVDFLSYHVTFGFLAEPVMVSKSYVLIEFDRNSGMFLKASIVDR